MFHDVEYDYSYQNKIYTYSIQYVLTYKQHNRFRLLGYYLTQDAQSKGFSNHDFRRRDFIPGFFYEYIWTKHILELGVMGSAYDWDYNAISQDVYEEQGIVEKVKIGWTYRFNNNAQFQFSISHVFSVFGFGGPNAQYQMFF